MIRLSSMTGLPVVSDGKVLGQVEQAVLTPDGRYLRGMVVRRGFGGARWLDASQVQVLGQVSVIAMGAPTRMPRDAAFAWGSVRDTAGLELGRVTDVYLSGEMYRVLALEITLGPLEDVRCGRMLARTFFVHPMPGDPGQVLIPTGCALEKVQEVKEE